MQASDFRKLTKKELEKKAREAKKDLVELKFKLRTENKKNTSEVRGKRKDLARMLTVSNEKEFLNIQEARESSDIKKEKMVISKKSGRIQKEKVKKQDPSEKKRGKTTKKKRVTKKEERDKNKKKVNVKKKSGKKIS